MSIAKKIIITAHYYLLTRYIYKELHPSESENVKFQIIQSNQP